MNDDNGGIGVMEITLYEIQEGGDRTRVEQYVCENGKSGDFPELLPPNAQLSFDRGCAGGRAAQGTAASTPLLPVTSFLTSTLFRQAG